MKIIDLSMNMQPMWRWPIKTQLVKDMSKGDPYQVTAVTTGLHSFTHVDTPLHIEQGRESIDEVALERLCGVAAVVDLTPVEAHQEITHELLKQRARHIESGDIVILKTNWDRITDYTTKAYWHEAPYLSKEAAEWLAEQPITAVGFDFPQDHAIREIPERHPAPTEMPTHDLILRKGILLIEYLCNLDTLLSARTEIYALPLKINGAEGSCARVVAVER